jgi:vitamin B12 transporter
MLLWALLFLSIQGRVLDPSGRPVPTATISCNGATATTNADGGFTLDTRPCQASVAAAGFETAPFPLAGGANNEIHLEVARLSERVIVTAGRREVTVEEAGVAASIVTREDLERRQFPALPEILREIPGLHVARFGRHGAATQVFARGSQRTGTLVLIDGVPVNDPGGDLNFAHLLSHAVERIEVVRGPQSALFGAEASAAVVQIFTVRGNPEQARPRGSLWIERGSFGTDRWATSLAGGSGERFDYALSTEQFHTVGEFPNDFYRNTTGSGSLNYRLAPSTRLHGLLRGFDSTAGSPNRVAYRMFDFDAHRRNRDYTAAFRVEDVRGSRFSQQAGITHHRLRDTFIDNVRDGPYVVAGLVTATT